MTHAQEELMSRQQQILGRALDSQWQVKELSVVDGVVRFRQDDGYNTSFAKQWKQFQLNQYDRCNQTTLYADRFQRETGWPSRGLDGELILEAGCGAGAFTCHLAATGADLVSFDYSSAVEVSAQHNANPHTVFAQADILDLPFSEGAFDRVFCHGVLQHTPDQRASFEALHRCVRPGGHLSIDVYRRDLNIRPHKSKYLWRWLTTRMKHEHLLNALRFYIPWWLPIDTLIKKIPVLGNLLGAIVPCWNYHEGKLTKEQRVEWAIMDTFDALAPAYDKPASLSDVERWFKDCGYTDFEVRKGGNGVVGNGIKPVAATKAA